MNDITQAAIGHYDRMIKWASKQDPKGNVDEDLMYKDLNESWSGEDCPFCDHYAIDDLASCGSCPLYARTEGNIQHCCGGKWHDMVIAKDWEDWIIRAEMVKLYIIEHGDLK